MIKPWPWLPAVFALSLALPACASTPRPGAASGEQTLAARGAADQRQAARAAAERGELRSERLRAAFGDPQGRQLTRRLIAELDSPRRAR